MARVIVMSDGDSGHVLMDEEVLPAHLDHQPGANQLIERLAWAIEDAHTQHKRFRRLVKPRSRPYHEVTG